ncbi:hypothetical protein KTN05_13135 [Paracoccus sp. Z118]|nr:hypothetical protein [Paracoccus sp. Z118]
MIHPDGYIQLKDRSKDIIISGGENVSSIKVENTLYAHPAVLACAVVAHPHEKWGETPVAYVELKEGASADKAELIAWSRQHLAPFKCPTDVVFTTIPRTSTGKIQKFRLRQARRAEWRHSSAGVCLRVPRADRKAVGKCGAARPAEGIGECHRVHQARLMHRGQFSRVL